jgi:signal peptidase II
MIYAICTLLSAALLGLDQWVKHWTTVHLALEESAPLAPGFVELYRVHNYGAAWSSFSGQRWLLVGVTGVILLAVAVALVRRVVRRPLGIIACFLILTGGLGNIIDRIRVGYVVDMFHFQFWPSYPVFNVADICVVCGCVLGAIYYLRLCGKEPREKTADGTTDAPSE